MKAFNTSIQNISRREFLQLSAYGLLGRLLPRWRSTPAAETPPLGRVMNEAVLAYSEPSFESEAMHVIDQDEVLPILGQVLGDGLSYNQSWYEVEQGYIHSSLLQPVADNKNEALEKMGPWQRLTEVTVPFSGAFVLPSLYSKTAYRYYYGSTHWIDRIEHDTAGRAWYRVVDDKEKEAHFYVQAEYLRVIPEDELTPLSPDAPYKHIDVRVADQMLIAYEESQPVFISQCSTGDASSNPKWVTPEGGYLTFYKRASRHMAAGNLAYGNYDLPGVPWVCYMTIYGIAIHGTYWHNDFGRPRSHGCVNLTPEAAKWVYRWTLPEVPQHQQIKYTPGKGTRVDIIYP